MRTPGTVISFCMWVETAIVSKGRLLAFYVFRSVQSALQRHHRTFRKGGIGWSLVGSLRLVALRGLVFIPLLPATRMNSNSPHTSHTISGNLPIQTSKLQRIITSKIFQLGPNGETLENPWTRDATIVVLKSNGRILGVRPTNSEDFAALARSNPSAGCDESKADVLDLRGLTILPGLIDTHVHRK